MKKIMLIMSLVISANLAHGQPTALKEMRVNLNETGSQYIKWTFLNQVWIRFNESNPGSLVLNQPQSKTVDIGLRRTRIQFFGQLSDHVFFYTQFGQNNFNYLAQNAGNRKLQAFFHDALGEYKVWTNRDWLKLGMGLTITNGLSRFSQPSVSTIMTTDVPVFAQATVDQTDEFSRKLSVYARGQIGRVDYRLIVSDPFPITTNGQQPMEPNSVSSFARVGHHKQYQAFLTYNFLEKEPHLTPYMTGTYLGKKRVLNLEAGIISQRKAMWHKAENGDTTFQSMSLWSAAVYYDSPISNNGSALSFYTGFFSYGFGVNYLRFNGIMNPANATSEVPGSQGNAFPMFGTGTIVYSQLGYLLKKNLFGENFGTLLPYVSAMSADYNAVKQRMNVWSAGISWLIHEHGTKLSLDYQNRPVYSSGTSDNKLHESGRRSQILLQYQISF